MTNGRRRSDVPTIGAGRAVVAALVAVVTIWSGAIASHAATSDPRSSLRAAMRATRDAPSFVVTLRQGGDRSPDSGDTGPITIDYNAPDRFRSVQRLAGEPGVTATIVQIGSDHYQQDSRSPGSWMHNTLPPGETGIAAMLDRVLTDPGFATVSRDGNVYRVTVPSQSTGGVGATGVATVAGGRVVSLSSRGVSARGKLMTSKLTFSRFGTAPKVERPTGTIQDG